MKVLICIHAQHFLYGEPNGYATSLATLMMHFSTLGAAGGGCARDVAAPFAWWSPIEKTFGSRKYTTPWIIMPDTLEPEGTFKMMMIDSRMMSVCAHLAALSAENRGHGKTRTDCSWTNAISTCVYPAENGMFMVWNMIHHLYFAAIIYEAIPNLVTFSGNFVSLSGEVHISLSQIHFCITYTFLQVFSEYILRWINGVTARSSVHSM